MADAETPRKIGYRELLAGNQAFRRLWLGEVVSYLGDWFNTIALYTIVQDLTGSAQAVSAVLIAKTLPIFLITPFSGPLIDRLDRRKLMIFTDIGRAFCALGLIVAHQLESLPLLFSVLVVMVCFLGVFMPTKNAVLPQITTKEELPAANALSGGTWSVMLAVGAAVGGVVTHLIGVDLSLLVDALTFVVSAFFLAGLNRLPPSQKPEDRDKKSSSFRAGLGYLKKRPYLSFLVSLKSCLALSSGAIVMLPIFGNGVFPTHTGPFFIGFLYSMRGLGALFGSLGIRQIFGDSQRVMRRLIAAAFGVVMLSYGGMAFTPSIWITAGLYLAGAVGSAVVWIYSGTLAQMASEQEYRGRLFSIEFGLMTLVISLVSWQAGLAIDLGGWTVREVAVASGLVLLLPLLGWLVLLLFVRAGMSRIAREAEIGSAHVPEKKGSLQWMRRWTGYLE